MTEGELLSELERLRSGPRKPGAKDGPALFLNQRGHRSPRAEFGRLKHEWALLPLRVRGLDRVRLHADLTILTKLGCALRQGASCTNRRLTAALRGGQRLSLTLR